jgi:7-keto-8-aminopelargonate synthetase-like enzyme
MGRFNNVSKMISVGMESWRAAAAHDLTLIRTTPAGGNRLRAADGHEFINMISCSYLGLNRHPKVIAGAMAGLQREGTMSVSASRARIGPALLDDVEAMLSELFGCHALTSISCAAASAGVLPVLASGHFTGGVKPYMVFDKNCHFSMSVMKASCGDETEVVVGPHNDIEYLERACRTHPLVAYVADGAYSLGDNGPIPMLLRLQERYGMFLYFDDSHSLSVYGQRGAGLVRSQLPELGERTIVVASLAKAFGATGGLIMLGTHQQRELLDYFGGPLSWSQMVNASGLGAIKAAAEIHFTEELAMLQKRLRANMERLDALVPTANSGNGLPIRVIELPGVSDAVQASAAIYRRGFYTSAVFFPIVAQGCAGLRVMGRADLEEHDLQAFCDALGEVALVTLRNPSRKTYHPSAKSNRGGDHVD